MKKKVLSIILALSIVFSIVCVGVNATEVAPRGAGAPTVHASANWWNAKDGTADLRLDATPSTNKINVDAVFVADVSLSMQGDRFENMKTGLKEAAKTLLTGSSSRVALVWFSSASDVGIELTRDLDAFNVAVDALELDALTDYGKGYKEAYDILAARDTTTNAARIVFVSDGVATSGYQTAVDYYNDLKSELNGKAYGLQYMMGSAVSSSFSRITDRTIAVDKVGDFKNGMMAVISEYEHQTGVVITGTLSEHFDFNIDSTTATEITTDGKNFTWNVGTLNYAEYTGFPIKLADSSKDKTGIIPVLASECKIEYGNGESQLGNNPELIRTNYSVTYVSGEGVIAPTDSTQYWTGEEVILLEPNSEDRTDDLIFRGWEDPTSSKILKPGDKFVMPGHDVQMKPVVSGIGNVTLEAIATNPAEPEWLAIPDNETAKYRVDKNVLRVKSTNSMLTLDVNIANGLKALIDSEDLSLAGIDTIAPECTPDDNNDYGYCNVKNDFYTTLKANEISGLKILDLSKLASAFISIYYSDSLETVILPETLSSDASKQYTTTISHIHTCPNFKNLVVTETAKKPYC